MASLGWTGRLLVNECRELPSPFHNTSALFGSLSDTCRHDRHSVHLGEKLCKTPAVQQWRLAVGIEHYDLLDTSSVPRTHLKMNSTSGWPSFQHSHPFLVTKSNFCHQFNVYVLTLQQWSMFGKPWFPFTNSIRTLEVPGSHELNKK